MVSCNQISHFVWIFKECDEFIVSDEIQEVLLFFPEINDIRPKAQIEDMQLLKRIVSKFGYKMRMVPSPFKEEVIEVVSKIYFDDCFHSHDLFEINHRLG